MWDEEYERQRAYVLENRLDPADLLLEENADILEELKDEKYSTRTHYKRSTYAKGCHGPLCRKAERDRGRDRHSEKQTSKGKAVTTMPPGEARERDEFLNKVIAWHWLVRSNPNPVERNTFPLSTLSVAV